MSDIDKQEQLVDRYVREGNSEEAIKSLLFLITKHAQQRDFEAAEVLREKIISIDPMALSEAIRAQEIIDSVRLKPSDSNHMEVWAELYDRLTVDEANTLYNETDEEVFQPGQVIFEQGIRKPNLYFIDSGVAKHLYKEGKREIFIKKISAGNFAGVETFFQAGYCTSTLVANDRVKLRFLPSEALHRWEKTMPLLENKLRDFCDREPKIHDLLAKSSMDRRKQRRVILPGRILIKVVGPEGEPVGKTLRGDMGDLSVGGISMLIKAKTRRQAQMLLGNDLFLRFNLPPNMKEEERIGTVLAVRQHVDGIEFEKNRYSIHLKFADLLAEKAIIEAARYLKMINATQH